MAALIAVGILGLVVFVLCGIVLELYRDVHQLRAAAGILDRPLDVDLGDVEGTAPSAHGLPAALDGAASAIVLFLSDRCATCHALARGLSGGLPAGLWVVLEARSPASADEFLRTYGLTGPAPHGRLLVDVAGRIAESIGLRTTPVGFRVQQGRIAGATTVPSQRYLSSILPAAVRLERRGTSSTNERKGTWMAALDGSAD